MYIYTYVYTRLLSIVKNGKDLSCKGKEKKMKKKKTRTE